MTYLSIPFLLQVFCIYHAYKNRKETHWYFIIFFLPIIGGIIYLVTQVFNKQDIAKAGRQFHGRQRLEEYRSHHLRRPKRLHRPAAFPEIQCCPVGWKDQQDYREQG